MKQLRTKEDILQEFASRGLSISAWARAEGYSSQLVYQVLSGKKSCLRGQCHEIAVRLGLKDGLIGNLADLPFAGIRETGGRQQD
jgi:gp16 family phage-associated protein